MGKPTEDIILKAIKNSGGVISAIANKLNVEWHTAQSYVNDYESTKIAYRDEEEEILDLADSALYGAIKRGEAWAIKWIQATKGKKRGYIERNEVTGKDGKDLIAGQVMFLSVDKLTDTQLEAYLRKDDQDKDIEI